MSFDLAWSWLNVLAKRVHAEFSLGFMSNFACRSRAQESAGYHFGQPEGAMNTDYQKRNSTLKIACVATYDAQDKNAFGGRGYHMCKALEERSISIDYLAPLRVPGVLSVATKVKRRFYGGFLGKRYTPERDSLLTRNYSQQISTKLKDFNIDIVFSPTSPGSQPVAYLDSEKPVVIWTDTPLAGVIDFYPSYGSDYLCKETIRDGLANERAALSRCSLVIYKSDWAAQTAIRHYGLPPSKVKVVPGGPGEDSGIGLRDIKEMIRQRPSNRCRLLFVGCDWERKGGQKALKVAESLNKMGLETTLSIVGCRPSLQHPIPDFVRCFGHISRSTKEGLERLHGLFAGSHFLIVPSLAEAMGMVFIEACSFGLPALTTNVGGIPTIIRDNVNGMTFSKDARISEYCEYVSNIFSDYSRYKELALSAFNEYRSRLNWSVAGRTVKTLMMDLLAR